jgi:hypothetical protein
VQPTRDRDASSVLPGCVTAHWRSLLGLAPNGGYLAAALLRTPVVSYTTVSPLPACPAAHLGGMFLWPVRQVAPSRELPGILLYGVRTFLDPGMQSRDLPTGLGEVIIHWNRGSVNYSRTSLGYPPAMGGKKSSRSWAERIVLNPAGSVATLAPFRKAWTCGNNSP